MQSDDLAVFERAIAGADKLPTVIIRVVRDVKNRLSPLKHLPRGMDRAVPRLIKWP